MGRWRTRLWQHADTIGIYLCGNFEMTEPTKEQIESTALLIAHLCQEYSLPIDNTHVLGHLDLRHDTACPAKTYICNYRQLEGNRFGIKTTKIHK